MVYPGRRTNNGDGFEGGYGSDLDDEDLEKIIDSEYVFEDWDSMVMGCLEESAGTSQKRYYPLFP